MANRSLRCPPAALLLILVGSWIAVWYPAPAQARQLSFEERVDAQRAIERVYWEQRTWPADNRGARPALETLLPDHVLRMRVEDYLKQSNALEALWGRPVTAEQLQAELHRITASTQAPETLRRLFAALDDDPYVIAETLARPTLVNRLVRNWFAADSRFQGHIRARAEQVLDRLKATADTASLGSAYTETYLRRVGAGTTGAQHGGSSTEPGPALQVLDDANWTEMTSQLAKRLGARLPTERWSEVYADRDSFRAVAILEKDEDGLRLATLRWSKTSFDTWWRQKRSSLPIALPPVTADYTVSVPEGSSTCTPDTWDPMLAGVPIGRRDHTAIWTGSEMIVWGGREEAYSTEVHWNTGGRYNPATDTWTATSTVGAPSARGSHAAAWTGTEMIVWGGTPRALSCPEFPLMSGGRYNPTTDKWTDMSVVDAPSARTGPASVWTGSKLLVWGGWTDVDVCNFENLRSGAEYDPTTDSWSPITSSPQPSRRSTFWTGDGLIALTHHGWVQTYDAGADEWTVFFAFDTAPEPDLLGGIQAWTGSDLIVWGRPDADNPALNEGFRFDPQTDAWSTMSQVNAPTGDGYRGVWTGSELIVWGGANILGDLGSGGIYDPVNDSWTRTTLFGAPRRRSGHTLTWTGSELIVWGGAIDDTTLSEGSRYDPVQDSWIPTAGNSPTTASTNAVWTGAEMIVWGGADFPSDAGARYDPALAAWTATSRTLAPSLRRYHSAVWTGSEMIVWGGLDASLGLLDDGATYDPTTDSWSPVPAAPESPARRGHTAIWSGTEMVVWGGIAPGFSNTGARYEPDSGAWTTTSPTDAPEARNGHTAVWTGTEMVVWGGSSNESGTLDSGGRYDPVADDWQPTPSEQAPSRRASHTSVWTGHEMIVWGGKHIDPLGDGARYDPAQDLWAPVPSIAAPSPRYRHSAVWTGAEMVVWGGRTDCCPIGADTGARYVAAAESWEPSTSVGAPDRRYSHNAVWTGERMIVWGGTANSLAKTNGALYCAPLDIDSDGDTIFDIEDCAPADASIWSDPGPASDLTLLGALIQWTPPDLPGGTTLAYDVLRSVSAADFSTSVCVIEATADTETSDETEPGTGDLLAYLVRSLNGCGTNAGSATSGEPRDAANCPSGP